MIWDVYPYINAKQQLNDALNEESAMNEIKKVAQDRDDIVRCEKKMDQYDRQCLLATMPQMRTTYGASYMGSIATYWLSLNPKDTLIRDRAKAMIRQAMERIPSEDQTTIDLAQAERVAHNSSFVLSTVYGHRNAANLRDEKASMLALLEQDLEVYDPK